MKQKVLLSLLVSGFLGVALYGQNDWKTYGNDPGHMRFSTLTQITPATGKPIESFGEKGFLNVNPGSPASLANARGPVVQGPASDAPSDVPARGRGRGAGAGPEAVGGGPAGRGGFGNGFSLSSPPAI